MSEERKKQEALAGVLDQVRDLTKELSSASATASRRWKVTAWTFGIICAVIAIYLTYIYTLFQPFLQPKALVEWGANATPRWASCKTRFPTSGRSLQLI